MPSTKTVTLSTTGHESIEELRDLVLDATNEAKVILNTAEKDDRGLSDQEKSQVDGLMLRAEYFSSRLKEKGGSEPPSRSSPEAKEYFAAAAREFGLGDETSGEYHPSKKKARGKAWGEAVVKACSDRDGLRKGITTPGAAVVSIPSPIPTSMGTPVTMVRSLIQTVRSNGRFDYFRQELRTNNAAAVPAGTQKPVSDYHYERIDDRCRTLAHLSTPIHKQDLTDSSLIQDFISSELLYGLERCLEEQILVGSGIGENLQGLANTPGVQTHTRSGEDDYSLILALREAITKLEVVGLEPTGLVLHPLDWQKAEAGLLTDGSLAFTAGGAQALPLDRSARRAWGVPVVTSISCPPGTAFMADFESTKLWVREEAVIDWSQDLYNKDMLGVGVGSTLFETNQIVFRCEGRFGFGVLRPEAIIKVDLTPVPVP